MKKNHKNSIIYITMLACAMLLAACSDGMYDEGGRQHGTDRIQLSGDIDQLSVTRVNDNGFCNGDVMGVYIVDYNGGTPGTLRVSGNHGDNVRHTYDETDRKWSTSSELYWNDKHTHIDVYGYYPYAAPESIDSYQFEVRGDQSTAADGGTLCGYEASDFLWGKVPDVAPTTSVIRLPLRHRMANARVTLVEGSGFASGEWTATDKQVLATNLVRKSSINLADGTVTASGSVEPTATVPSRTGDEWRAIVVPQTVAGGTTLFSITIGGVPYKFAKSEAFTYTAGKMSNFSIRVDKKTDSGGQYKLTLISESITPWENDLVSHDATAKEYLVINCTAGNLSQICYEKKIDYTKIKNLKVTGEINAADISFMSGISALEALNIKEARIIAQGKNYEDDEIPSSAFFNSKINHIVLPDKLKKIGRSAFHNCNCLVGSLNIPEGVEVIDDGAFMYCKGLDGTLTLPSTLKKIGNYAFYECSSFTGNLDIPENIETIGSEAFIRCHGFYGELHLPNSLKKIGVGAFSWCSGLTGSLIIPHGITEIEEDAFSCSGFNGNLVLHDGITNIDDGAFSGCNLITGELTLPKNLKTIGANAFASCSFSGTLHLPSSLLSIGADAFSGNSQLTGVLEIPEKITSIKDGTFSRCHHIEGIVLPANMETINSGAFSDCYGIGSIVCKGTLPSYVKSGAFDGVPKDNFTVEVPEPSVAQYQTTAGWNEFKRIAAHHELVCRPSVACALATEHKQTLVINAEGEWEVESKPDWCDVSPMSGNKKSEVTLTINAMANNGSSREGKVVFRLKDKDYTHECSVSQYGYEYGEDQWLTLQKATKGRNGGINIVLLGDGYSAKEIADGSYLKAIKQEMEYFFGLEPYTTYRDYFNVYTAFPLSTESGVGTVNTIRYNRFGTTFTGGVKMSADYDEIFAYALNAPTVTKGNLNQTLIIMVPNTTEYGGVTQLWTSGAAIAFCPQSTNAYPLDSRGVVQHEAGGHGFGKLADEYIYHNAFIDNCHCMDGCDHGD
ncbi:MAG: leucine-rich repeat protein, partial [Prevotella sp.]|nr:leucine-rich repeat protein [Prevotella sp.]